VELVETFLTPQDIKLVAVAVQDLEVKTNAKHAVTGVDVAVLEWVLT
jgi:hypothetical protein